MPVCALPRISKLALLALVSLACAKAPPSGGPGTYRGVATNKVEIGIFEVTVEDAAKGPLPAKGTVTFPSKTLTLTGTLDQSKTTLALSSDDGYLFEAVSRPNYALGSYQNAALQDMGTFGLMLESAGVTIERFCGSMTDASDSGTQGTALPLAITATPGGDAICVAPGFTWMGSFGNDNSVSCISPVGVIRGNVTASVNSWDSDSVYGSWAVVPCASNGAGGDAGVSDGPQQADAAEADAGI